MSALRYLPGQSPIRRVVSYPQLAAPDTAALDQVTAPDTGAVGPGPLPPPPPPPPGAAEAAPAPGPDAPLAPPTEIVDPKPAMRHTGWRIKDADGNILADMPMNPAASQDYQSFTISKVGKSLMDQAVTDDEKKAATRALAFGLSRAGSASTDEISKDMVHRYDTDVGNATKVQIQGMHHAKGGGGGGGPGGPAGPSKSDKFDNSVALDAQKLVESAIGNQETQSKLGTLREHDADLQKLEALISSPNALSQRAEIAEYMKELTGKVATDKERGQILGAAGRLSQLENDLNLWSPSGDASLSKNYIAKMKEHVQTLRRLTHEHIVQIGRDTQNRVMKNPYVGKYANAKEQGKYAYNAIVGEDPPDDEAPAAASSSAPAAPAPPRGFRSLPKGF